MKPIFTRLLAICFLFSGTTFAQDGNWAPNFTLTDINGVEYRLYDYLAEGKTVIINFAATWCAPCWDEHESHVLQDIYGLYGPDGTDELMIFFMESDPDMGLAQLQGIEGPSQGNWIEGTPYPIIDAPDIAIPNAFGIFAYPTIYVICPDMRILTNIWSNQWSVEWVMDHVMDCEGRTPPSEDAILHAYPFYQTDCFEGNVSANIINGGTIPLTFAQIRGWNQGEEIFTHLWTGNLAFGEGEVVDLGTYPLLEGSNDFSLELMLVDFDQSNNYTQVPWEKAPSASNQLIVYLETDENAVEDNTRWYIEDEEGNIIAENEPLNPNEYTETYITIESTGCYSFVILDDGNNGLGNGFITLSDVDDNLLFSATNFGEEGGTLLNISSVVSTQNLAAEYKLNLFPNPVDEELSISFETEAIENISLEIINVMGESLVFENRSINVVGLQNMRLMTKALASGIYFLNIRMGDQLISKKFVKK